MPNVMAALPNICGALCHFCGQGRVQGYNENDLFMAALRSRCGHYIFAHVVPSIFFFFFSSPNLSGRRVDVYHTCTHGVALVRI